MQTGYKVIDAMTRKPYTAPPGTTLRALAVLMREKGVGSMLLQDDGRLVGIVTEWDLIRRGMAMGLDPERTTGEKVMTPMDEMAVADPGMDIFEALKLMRERDIRHLPVLDAGRMVGFITMKDVLKIQPQLFELIAEKYELRESERKPFKADAGTGGECALCRNYSDRLVEVRGVVVCPDCVQDVEE